MLNLDEIQAAIIEVETKLTDVTVKVKDAQAIVATKVKRQTKIRNHLHKLKDAEKAMLAYNNTGTE